MMPSVRTSTIALLGLGWVGVTSALSNGTFTWPASTQQCGTYNVTIYDGSPPWTLVLAPMNGQPIYWDITAPPRYDASRAVDAQIPLQLTSGQPYTVFMQDSTGYFTGINPTQVQVVGLGTESSCLIDVISHTQDFTFTVSGATSMCEDDFSISWLDQVGTGPYNFTVLPLDSSTSPWDQQLTGGGTTTGASGWAVNMTSGTRFTIMMNNGNGYGAGGIGGIYEVAAGSSNSCIVAPVYTTAAWPAGLETTTILTAAQLPTSVITSRSVRPTEGASDLSGDDAGAYSDAPTTSRQTAPPVTVVVTASGSSGGLSTGAAAGIGAGIGVVVLAAIGFGVWFCLRKRKNGAAVAKGTYAAPVDLNDDTGHAPRSAVEPKIEPYPTPGLSQAPEMPYAQSSNNFSHSNVSSPTEGHNYAQYGMAAGAAAAGYGQHQHQQQYSPPIQQGARSSMAYSESQLSPGAGGHERYSMSSSGNPQVNPYFPTTGQIPGQAGPLPSKADMARQSYVPAAQSYGPTGGLSPHSPGSVSGSSSSGRGLPMPPGMGALSESGASDSKTNLQSPGSHTPSQGHGFAPAPQEAVFNIHRDAEAEPAQQSGMIDLPPMYQDVPQRREGGAGAGAGGEAANAQSEAHSPQSPHSREGHH